MNRRAAGVALIVAGSHFMNTFQHTVCHLLIMNPTACRIHALSCGEGQVRCRGRSTGKGRPFRITLRRQSWGARRRGEGGGRGGGCQRPLRELARVGQGAVYFMCNARADVHLRRGTGGSRRAGGLRKKFHQLLMVRSHGNEVCRRVHAAANTNNKILSITTAVWYSSGNKQQKPKQQSQVSKQAVTQASFPYISATAKSDENQLEIECVSRWVRASVHHTPDPCRPAAIDEDRDPVAPLAMTPL